jgi:hypothetical protein
LLAAAPAGCQRRRATPCPVGEALRAGGASSSQISVAWCVCVCVAGGVRRGVWGLVASWTPPQVDRLNGLHRIDVREVMVQLSKGVTPMSPAERLRFFWKVYQQPGKREDKPTVDLVDVAQLIERGSMELRQQVGQGGGAVSLPVHAALVVTGILPERRGVVLSRK